MTIQELRDRVDAIRACAGDDEAAHGMEDQLHRDVLNGIAQGHFEGINAIRAAAIALSTDQINFARWCA